MLYYRRPLSNAAGDRLIGADNVWQKKRRCAPAVVANLVDNSHHLETKIAAQAIGRDATVPPTTSHRSHRKSLQRQSGHARVTARMLRDPARYPRTLQGIRQHQYARGLRANPFAPPVA